MVGRLVEQQQVGAAQQRLRQVEAHAPAAGEVRDRALEVAGREAEAGEQGRGARPRAVAVDGLEPGVQFGQRCGRRGPHRPRRSRVRRGAAPRRRRARTRCAACGSGGVSCATEAMRQSRGTSQSPVSALEFAAQQGEQARLAAAVGADDADPPAGVDLQRGVLDQAAHAARQGKLAELDQGAGLARNGARILPLWRRRGEVRHNSRPSSLPGLPPGPGVTDPMFRIRPAAALLRAEPLRPVRPRVRRRPPSRPSSPSVSPTPSATCVKGPDGALYGAPPPRPSLGRRR